MTHCTKVSASCHLKRGPLPHGHREARPLACDIRYGSPRRVSLFCYSASSLGRSPGSCRMPRTPPPPIPLRRPAPGPGGGAACHAPHLVLAAFARLQTGEDLALDGLDPRVPLLVRGGFEVPRLAREGHNDELEVFFLFWNTGGWGGGVKSLALTRPGPQRRSSVLRGFWAQGARAGLAACRLQSRVRRPAAHWALHPGPLAQPFRPLPRGRER